MTDHPLPTESGPLPDMRGYSVLQVLPRLETGGVERGTIEMVRAIVAAGGKALVASAGGGMEPQVAEAGGRHVTLPLASKNPLRIINNGYALADLVKREKIDLIHARSRAPAWSAKMAAKRAGVPFVTTYHGLYSSNLPFKHLYNSVMAAGDRVIAISQGVSDHIQASYGLTEERIRLIHRGVDLDYFDPRAEDLDDRIDTLAQRWLIPTDADRPFLILLPARLTRWKGHTQMLDALAKLKDPAMVLMVGSGDIAYQEELMRRAATLNLSPMVQFVGKCSDMPAAYAMADLVVTPSQRPEAFGRTVIEAQAMERPVIASELGGALETIVSGANGWLVAPGNANALAEAIDSVMALSPAGRHAIGMAGRRSVERQFTTTKMQAATLAVYRELMPDSLPESLPE